MTEADSPHYKPLYAQVKATFIARIATGLWAAGVMIPSEMELAAELHVSQGTVRKALDEMTAENMLTRRQGVGTFVAKHDEARILFQFFKLQADNGARSFPESEIISQDFGVATVQEVQTLGLKKSESVMRLVRVRSLNGVKALIEKIVLPASLFPELEKHDLPNNLYGYYSQKFGITVAKASERIKASAATAQEAQYLEIAQGTPLLQIDRLALSIDGRAVEWRVSSCKSDDFHYVAELK
jgi:GntR family transcriptional regulator